MAGLLLQVNSGDCTLVASTAKTILQAKAPSNQALVIKAIKISGKSAAGGSDAPVKYRLTRSTANFGTATGGATVGKLDDARGETAQGTYGENFTVEPTSPTDAGFCIYVNPQLPYERITPLDMPIVVAGGHSIQLEATSTGTPTVSAEFVVEE